MVKKAHKSLLKQIFVISLVVNFAGCAFSIGTVYAGNNEVKSSHNCSDTNNQTGENFTLTNHHLLSQPQPLDNFNVVLPEISFDQVLSNLSTINFNRVEIINNQGAPPLSEPLKVGVVNSKIW